MQILCIEPKCIVIATLVSMQGHSGQAVLCKPLLLNALGAELKQSVMRRDARGTEVHRRRTMAAGQCIVGIL